MASANVIELTAANWEQEVVKSNQPVLIDFWAVWCGPCRQLAPTIDKIAGDFAGKVKVGKVNTEDAPEIAAKYRISAIPRSWSSRAATSPSSAPRRVPNRRRISPPCSTESWERNASAG